MSLLDACTPSMHPSSPCWPAGELQPAQTRPTLHLHERGDAQRDHVESYIAQRYRQRYGARLTEWMPQLVSVQIDGEILAAAGYRSAVSPLFLERYLSAPVECYLREDDRPVTRARVVESGQFAAARPGAGRLLVPLLARHLHRCGFEWTVSTLTDELHHLFTRMKLTHQPLAAADPDLLSPAERLDWGSYYDRAPTVYAGRLSDILKRFPETLP